MKKSEVKKIALDVFGVECKKEEGDEAQAIKAFCVVIVNGEKKLIIK